MTTRQLRLLWIFIIGSILCSSLGLFLYATQNWVSFALNPAEIARTTISPTQHIRLYGLVKEGSLVRGAGRKVSFTLTLEGVDLAVDFDGELPGLFREGQGLIAEGRLPTKDLFIATRVLAKHDENYVPAELVDKLKDEGVWRGDDES